MLKFSVVDPVFLKSPETRRFHQTRNYREILRFRDASDEKVLDFKEALGHQ